MSPSYQGTTLLVLLILFICCVGWNQGQVKVPSVYDCDRQKEELVLDCRNHGFQNVPYDHFKHFGAYKM